MLAWVTGARPACEPRRREGLWRSQGGTFLSSRPPDLSKGASQDQKLRWVNTEGDATQLIPRHWGSFWNQGSVRPSQQFSQEVLPDRGPWLAPQSTKQMESPRQQHLGACQSVPSPQSTTCELQVGRNVPKRALGGLHKASESGSRVAQVTLQAAGRGGSNPTQDRQPQGTHCWRLRRQAAGMVLALSCWAKPVSPVPQPR